MTKRFAILIILVAVFAFSLAPSHAAAVTQGFHNVNITYAGPMFNVILIKADAVDQSFTNQWFKLNLSNDKALLATALTLISTGAQARIWVLNDPHSFAGIPVQTCYSVLYIAP